MDKPTRYRELLRLVRKYGIYEDRSRAKGSERLWVKEYPDGSKRSIPVTCHGANYVISVGLIKAIRRRFSITEKDGVADKDFYSKK
ncbi:MAG: hypothetical protein ACE5PV_26655 [Candidatus Poribacteria bacterium]